MALVKLNKIAKSYSDGGSRVNHVLRDVNLEVQKGEFLAIRGESGSGKSTLLSILGALTSPDQGEYLFNEVEIDQTDRFVSIMRNSVVGFMYQNSRLLAQLNVLDNILLPTVAFVKSATQAESDYARKLMELTHISHIADQYPETLSGGEASRVALCRALIMKPSLLLADEPTGQLDRENAQNIAALLGTLSQELGTTVVMVTHSDELSAVADRVLTLKEGMLQ